MKQRTIANEEQEQPETVEEAFFNLLVLPTKNRLAVYTQIVIRWLKGHPLSINLSAYEILSATVGLEREAIKEKIISLDGANFIHVEYWSLLPRFKLKEGVTEEQLTMAIKHYQEAILDEQRMTIDHETLWRKMNDVCKHTKKERDPELCEMHRWDDCDGCRHRGSMK